MFEIDLSIPECLDLSKPEVAARRQREREAPVTNTMRNEFADNRKRELDAATKAFLDAEAERERVAKENSLATYKAKQEAQKETTLGGRWDAGRNLWVSPEQDLAEMAARITPHKTKEFTVEELRQHFETVANHPEYPADGCRAFAKRILSHIDNGKLALEAAKALVNARRRAKRKANANACAAKPRRRRRVA